MSILDGLVRLPREGQKIAALGRRRGIKHRYKMCPFCRSALALAAAGTTSVGGLAVLAMKVLHKNRNAQGTVLNPQGEEQSKCLRA
jgi:hypothetical protein